MHATHQSTDRRTFLANLRSSGLLDGDRLEKLLPTLPESDRGRPVARHLVEHGVLTKFQAEMVLAGRVSGFQLGQYRILDQLGRGGMGRIFKAEHQTMNRIVALKVMSAALVKTPQAQKLFQREVRAAAKLVHPNIVTAYDANQAGDRYYLVMEFVNGPNLEELVRDQGPLPVGQACEFVRQAAVGLQYASDQGMVHRDIKPSNLLVQLPVTFAPSLLGSPLTSAVFRSGSGVGKSGAGRVGDGAWTIKILDFGLARLNAVGPDGTLGDDSITTGDNSVMGTPDYVSPEQTRNLHQVDIRSDLYSLGCTWYFLLTGTVPFPGGTAMDKMLRHNTDEPKPLRELRPDVPVEVADLVGRLMAKDPAQRLQTPAELVHAVTPFAVAGAPPVWKPLSSADSIDLAPTNGPTVPDTAAQDDESALSGTLPGDASQTPGSIDGMKSVRLRLRLEDDHQRRVKIALVSAAALVVGFLLVCWVSLR